MDNDFWNNSGVSDNDVNNVMSLFYDTLLAQAMKENEYDLTDLSDLPYLEYIFVCQWIEEMKQKGVL